MGKKSTPPAPDYAGAAREQAQASREVTEQQTWANRPDQVTPFGSQTWENQLQWDPSTQQYLNRWRQNTTLTPESQSALNAQLGVMRDRSQLAQDMTGRLRDEMGQPMDWNRLPATGQNVTGTQLDSSGKYYDDAGDAIYGQWADRALPEQARQTEALDAQLYNRGLRPGDEAYDRELQKLRESQSDAQRQASYQATIGAGSEASRALAMDAAASGQNFQQDMASSQYQNQLRQQAITEEMQRRGFTLNEINAAMSGQQVAMPNMPNFTPAQRAEGTQALAAAQMQGQYGIDQFNAEQAGINGLLSGLGSSALGAYGLFGNRS